MTVRRDSRDGERRGSRMESTDPTRCLGVYRPYLRAMAEAALRGTLAPRMDPSDLVQETLLRASTAKEQFRGKTDQEFAAWLQQILQNILIDAIRHHQSGKRDLRREEALSESLEMLGESPSGIVRRSEDLSRIAAALQQLSEEQRSVIVWRSEGATFEEIGERTQRSADAARMLWGRAVKRMLKILEPNDQP